MNKLKLLMLLAVMPIAGIAQELKGTDLIPFDPTVKTGKLKNGLTYYIRKNAKPENKVDLRLVVNAGSILEDDDQQGLAHFLEHLCFNDTKNFPKNSMKDYLESIGVRYGQHLNAYTSFDETVYFLPIPSNDPEKLEKGFLVLEDWAFNAILTPEGVDKERSIVLEEMRMRDNADSRMIKRFMPKTMNQSHYPNRWPIGQKEIIENFKYDKIKKFYEDWYRPNLMAVIVVGDIDVAEMEKKIIDHFSSYQNPKNERPRKVFDLPNHEGTRIAIETEKEATTSTIQLIYNDFGEAKPVVTVNDLKKEMAGDLFSYMLNIRLRELTKSPNPPFTGAYASHSGTMVRSKEAYQLYAKTEEGKQLSSLKALIDEHNRIKKYGFSESEFERAKTASWSRIQEAYNESDKYNSEMYVDFYQRHFLEKKRETGIEWYYNSAKELFSQITLPEVNELINTYMKDDNRVVIFQGPEKENTKKPTEEEVLGILNQTNDDIQPYEEGTVVTGLLRKEIKAGSITKTENNAKLGTTTLHLSNGAKVTYKKTDFQNDEILMEAVSFGGTNLYNNDDYKKTQWANGGLTEAGFSGLTRTDINRFMTGKTAEVKPYITHASEGLNGSSTVKDMEYMFQITHAYFTDLNFDSQAYETYRTKMATSCDNMESDPDYYFVKEVMDYLCSHSPRWNGQYPTKKTLMEGDYELAYKKYKERFGNAGDFEFFFVGNINDKAMEEFSAKYIASLPSTNKREKAVSLKYRALRGNLKKLINKGILPKSKVGIIYSGYTSYNAKEAMAFEALGEILSIKLTENLRENDGGVYSIGASGSMEKVPHGSYHFYIGFPCGPENAEKLAEDALNELYKIIDNGPEATDLAKYKEAEILDYKRNMKENEPWLKNLVRTYTDGRNAEDMLMLEDRINGITEKDVQQVAKKYLAKKKTKLVAILMPEKN